MRKFENDNSIFFECEYKDFDGTFTDPTSPSYEILDSSGNQETTGTPTKQSTGIYYFYWKPTVEDTYVVKFIGTIAGNLGAVRETFKVKETSLS